MGIASQHRDVLWRSRCSCGSWRKWGACCPLDKRGFPVPSPVDTRPRGKSTKLRHSKCYLAQYGNCSAKLTREHYPPLGVLQTLDRFGSVPVMGGAPWLVKNEEREVSWANVAVRCLCERHNTAFSPLDDQLLRLAKAVIPGENVNQYPVVGGRLLITFNANDIERAILKTGAAMWWGGTAPSQTGGAVTGDIPTRWLRAITGERPLPSHLGLRLRSKPGDRLWAGEIEVGLIEWSGAVFGARLLVHGLELVVLTRDDWPPGVGRWLADGCDFGFPVEVFFDTDTGPRLLYFGGRGPSAGRLHRPRRRPGSMRRP